MAPYKLVFRASFRKDLKQLPQDIVRRVVRKVDTLADNPFPADVKRLRGQNRLFRVRVGDYRVLYEVDTEVRLVALVNARHRKDVYRRFG